MWLEKAPLQTVGGQEQGVTSENGNVSNLHTLRIHVSISPSLSPVFKSSCFSDVSTSSSCASSAAWGDEIYIRAALVLRFCSF